MKKSDLLNILILGLDAHGRATALRQFREVEGDTELLAIYPSKETYESALERAVGFRYEGRAVPFFAYEALTGDIVTGGALYCRSTSAKEIAAIWGLLGPGAQQLIME